MNQAIWSLELFVTMAKPCLPPTGLPGICGMKMQVGFLKKKKMVTFFTDLNSVIFFA